jgi:glutathione S-transferase
MQKSQIRFTSFVPQDRSGRVRWCLEELGVAYDRETLDFKTGATTTPEYLRNHHPLGMVPAFRDGDFKMIESGAICLYLAEKYGERKLTFAPGSEKHFGVLQWMFLTASHLDSIAAGVSNLSRISDETARAQKLVEYEEDFAMIAASLEDQLSHGNFIMGEFSLADIMVGQDLYWSEDVLLPKYPKLVAYLDRLKARPAAVKAEVFKDS